MPDSEDVNFGIIEIEHDDEECVDEVEDDEDGGQDPGCHAGEEQRVAATRVVEQETRGFLERGAHGGELVDGPDEEAEETRVEGVAREGEERHY